MSPPQSIPESAVRAALAGELQGDRLLNLAARRVLALPDADAPVQMTSLPTPESFPRWSRAEVETVAIAVYKQSVGGRWSIATALWGIAAMRQDDVAGGGRALAAIARDQHSPPQLARWLAEALACQQHPDGHYGLLGAEVLRMWPPTPDFDPQLDLFLPMTALCVVALATVPR